jgi:ribonuclease HI
VNDILIDRGEPPINWDPSAEIVPLPAPRPTLTGGGFVDGADSDDGGPPPAPIYPPFVAPPPPVLVEPTYTMRGFGNNDAPPLDINTLWIFTDGGATGNGRARCRASWAFSMTDGAIIGEGYGLVPEINIPGVAYKSSNNRGELTAIIAALDFILLRRAEFDFTSIILVSDSKYSINALDVWIRQWLADPEGRSLATKMNLDLIMRGKQIIDQLRVKCAFEFRHVRGHRAEPDDRESEEWFVWYYNDLVDKLCGKALGGEDAKGDVVADGVNNGAAKVVAAAKPIKPARTIKPTRATKVAKMVKDSAAMSKGKK